MAFFDFGASARTPNGRVATSSEQRMRWLCQVKSHGFKKARSGVRNHAAAAAFRHSLAASALKIRSVDRETRWR